MNAHRISTLIILAASLFAFFALIPAGTETIDYGTLSPGTMPRLLSLVIAGLAAIQLFSTSQAGDIELPSLVNLLRAITIFCIALVMLVFMNILGFLLATLAIATSAAFLMREKRLPWFALSAWGMPLIIWLFVTQILDRSLPQGILAW